MKKNYVLSTVLAGIMGLFSTAQVVESINYDGLTLGDVNTNFDNSAAGQGGYFTFATNTTASATTTTTTTNAGNANFQIVAAGRNGSQGLQFIGPNGNQGTRQMTRGSLASNWASRTAGNEIIETEFWFNTGSSATSDTSFRILQFADDAGTSRIAVALQYNSLTRQLRGLANLNNAGAVGFFGFDIGPSGAAGTPGPLVLADNTWYNVGMAYDTTNGNLRWVTNFGTGTNVIFTNAGNVITGMSPTQSVLVAFPANTAGVPNTAPASIVYDDFQIRATAVSELLNIQEVNTELATVSMYPNPTAGSVSVTSDSGSRISEISMYDMSGKLMITEKVGDVTFTKDVSNFKSGMYLLQIIMENGSVETQKLAKL